jgi:hypothetical protein
LIIPNGEVKVEKYGCAAKEENLNLKEKFEIKLKTNKIMNEEMCIILR